MIIEATPEEWAIIRQTLSRGCAHLGAELANVGVTGAGIAAQILAVIAAIDARIGQALAPPTESAD